MIVHNFDPVLIDLGLFQIRWYSIAYIVGIILGWIYSNKIIKEMTKKYNFTLFNTEVFDNLIIYLILGIILGGRLGYVVFYNFDYYSQNLYEILKLWEGGMSFHGGLLGVIIATVIFSKVNKIGNPTQEKPYGCYTGNNVCEIKKINSFNFRKNNSCNYYSQ